MDRAVSFGAEDEQVAMSHHFEHGRCRAALDELTGDLSGELLSRTLYLVVDKASCVDPRQVSRLRRVGMGVHVRVHPRMNHQQGRAVSICCIARPFQRSPRSR
jgi:hypothetical protein